VLEPKPLTILEHEITSEDIRVGIVLREDQKEVIHITVKTRLLCRGIDDQACTSIEAILERGAYTVQAQASLLTIENQFGEILLTTPSLYIQPEQETFPHPSLMIAPIVAGRSFHWKKEIEADFPGAFELTAVEGNVEIVNVLPFEQYLACVVVSEMSSGTPIEFVKAQTIAARSWAKCFINEKHPGATYQLCNDDDCQRYHGVTFASEESLRASLDTAGQYLVSRQGSIIPAYYSKCCGGITEELEDCLGFAAHGIASVTDGVTVTHIGAIEDWISRDFKGEHELFCGGSADVLLANLGGVDDVGEYFRWTHEESKTSIASYLNERTTVTDALAVIALIPLRRGKSGRIHEMEFTYETTSGDVRTYVSPTQYEIRSLLHASFLYSSAISIQEKSDSFVFQGAGWGHGVGLCQIGGMFQAIAGRTYQDILTLYFPESTLKTLY
jgi:SpoIID/LytB domain protein